MSIKTKTIVISTLCCDKCDNQINMQGDAIVPEDWYTLTHGC